MPCAVVSLVFLVGSRYDIVVQISDTLTNIEVTDSRSLHNGVVIP